MVEQPLEFDPYKLAAVLYRTGDDVDSLLADFATDRIRAGEHIGGVVQKNGEADKEARSTMEVVDLMTGRVIPISQRLGSGSGACQLDSAGLAEASQAVVRAIDGAAMLVVINKFGGQEAAGTGLRSELTLAVLAGIPVLTAVSEKWLGAWTDFTGDRGTTLLCERSVVDGWWEDVSSRIPSRQQIDAAVQREPNAGSREAICRP